jgi:hypothetical protein
MRRRRMTVTRKPRVVGMGFLGKEGLGPPARSRRGEFAFALADGKTNVELNNFNDTEITHADGMMVLARSWNIHNSGTSQKLELIGPRSNHAQRVGTE